MRRQCRLVRLVRRHPKGPGRSIDVVRRPVLLRVYRGPFELPVVMDQDFLLMFSRTPGRIRKLLRKVSGMPASVQVGGVECLPGSDTPRRRADGFRRDPVGGSVCYARYLSLVRSLPPFPLRSASFLSLFGRSTWSALLGVTAGAAVAGPCAVAASGASAALLRGWRSQRRPSARPGGPRPGFARWVSRSPGRPPGRSVGGRSARAGGVRPLAGRLGRARTAAGSAHGAPGARGCESCRR